MKRMAYTLELKNSPDLIKRYKEYHAAVWPEVLHGIRKSGVRRSQIYLLGTRLFLFIEAEDDYDADNVGAYATGDKEREWERIMRTFQMPVAEAKPGEWWARMELVYDFEEQISRSSVGP